MVLIYCAPLEILKGSPIKTVFLLGLQNSGIFKV